MGNENNEGKDDEADELKAEEHVSEFSSNFTSLLANFRSAKLVSPPSESKTPSSCGCSDITSSLQAVHICRPVNGKQRLRRLVQRSKKKEAGNHLNLAIAASCHHKPLLWPARLSRSRKTLPSKLLHPARLKCNAKHSFKQTPESGKCPLSCLLNEDVVGSLRSNTSLDLSAVRKAHGSKVPGADRLFGSKQGAEGSTGGPSSFRDLSKFPSAASDTQGFQLAPGQSISNSDLYRTPFSHASWSSDVGSSSRRRSSPASGWCGSGSVATPHGAGPTTSALESTAASLSSALPRSESESSLVGRSCSHEMRMEETNVNELASYLDDFLHIPKKMSSMAEMMYA